MSQAIESKPNKGAWQPGVSGNPGGRPKLAKSLTDALRKRVEEGAGEEIAANVIRLATKAKQEAVQVKAAEFVADRLEGRPMQAIAMLQVMDDNTANRLVQLATILTGNALPISAPTITLDSEQSVNVSNAQNLLPELPDKPSQKKNTKVTKAKHKRNKRGISAVQTDQSVVFTHGIPSDTQSQTDQSVGVERTKSE